MSSEETRTYFRAMQFIVTYILLPDRAVFGARESRAFLKKSRALPRTARAVSRAFRKKRAFPRVARDLEIKHFLIRSYVSIYSFFLAGKVLIIQRQT